jgi:hypothetical protein
LKKLEAARKEGDLLRKSIIEKFVEKDEKGDWKQEQGNFIVPDNKKMELEKEMECFMKLPIEIEYYKLNLSELKDVKITAIDLMAMEPFIEEDDLGEIKKIELLK